MGSRMLPLRGPSPRVGARGRQMSSNVVGWGTTAQTASFTATTHPRLTQDECGSPCFGHTLSPVLEKVPLAQPKATLSWMRRVNPGVDSSLPPAGFSLSRG